MRHLVRRKKGISRVEKLAVTAILASVDGKGEITDPSQTELTLLAGFSKEQGHTHSAKAFEDMLEPDDRPKRRA